MIFVREIGDVDTGEVVNPLTTTLCTIYPLAGVKVTVADPPLCTDNGEAGVTDPWPPPTVTVTVYVKDLLIFLHGMKNRQIMIPLDGINLQNLLN